MCSVPFFFFLTPFSVGRAVSCLDCYVVAKLDSRAAAAEKTAQAQLARRVDDFAKRRLPTATGLRRRAQRAAQKGGRNGALLRTAQEPLPAACRGGSTQCGGSSQRPQANKAAEDVVGLVAPSPAARAMCRPEGWTPGRAAAAHSSKTPNSGAASLPSRQRAVRGVACSDRKRTRRRRRSWASLPHRPPTSEAPPAAAVRAGRARGTARVCAPCDFDSGAVAVATSRLRPPIRAQG